MIGLAIWEPVACQGNGGSVVGWLATCCVVAGAGVELRVCCTADTQSWLAVGDHGPGSPAAGQTAPAAATVAAWSLLWERLGCVL